MNVLLKPLKMTADYRADRMNSKIAVYLGKHVAMVWVIDPEMFTVTVYANDSGPQRFGEKDRLTAEEILPGFRCKVADFFELPGRNRGKRKTKGG